MEKQYEHRIANYFEFAFMKPAEIFESPLNSPAWRDDRVGGSLSEADIKTSGHTQAPVVRDAAHILHGRVDARREPCLYCKPGRPQRKDAFGEIFQVDSGSRRRQ